MLQPPPQKKDPLKGIQKAMTMAKEKVYREGEMLFTEDSEDPNFYIILKGNVEVKKKISGGKPKVIAQVGEGEFLGEGVLFGNSIKPASAEAVTEVTALPISAKNFSRLINEDCGSAVDFLLYVVEAANKRLTKTNKKLLAVNEINQIINFYRDDIKQLSENLVKKALSVTVSSGGMLLLKDPKKSDYKVLYSTSSDLDEKTLSATDLEKAQIIESEKRHLMTAGLKDIGAIVLTRSPDVETYDPDQLGFLALIADQIAYTVMEANKNS